MAQERILVVDDDKGLLQLLKMRLTAMGFDAVTCPTGEEAIAEARHDLFDVAITDLRLRNQDGLAVMEQLHLLHPTLPVLILTAHGSIPNAVEAVQKGAWSAQCLRLGGEGPSLPTFISIIDCFVSVWF